MWILYLLSWLSVLIQISFITLAVACGLYYLAEVIEEYTVLTCKIIKVVILITLGIYLALLLFEDLPTSLLICGALSQVMHLMILRTFPYFILTSIPFISASVLLIVSHYLALSHFTYVYYPFSEVMAFFTVCVWLVPFAFFVSLSANENILPTYAEARPLLPEDNDVVTNYFSRKTKRYGLLSFFNYAKESILPQRIKKSF